MWIVTLQVTYIFALEGLLGPEQVSTCKVPIVFRMTTFSSQMIPLPEHTPKLTKLGIYITRAQKCHNLLSPFISTTRWCYNQGKCVLAISTLSLNIWFFFFFLRKFAKCRKSTFLIFFLYSKHYSSYYLTLTLIITTSRTFCSKHKALVISNTIHLCGTSQQQHVLTRVDCEGLSIAACSFNSVCNCHCLMLQWAFFPHVN